MPINKNAFIRYQALDRCFSNSGRNFYIEDLLEACNQALELSKSGAEGIQRRQLFDDIKFMESSQGWSIPLQRIKNGKKVYYRYSDPKFSINQHALRTSEFDELREAVQVLKRIKTTPHFKWMYKYFVKFEKLFQIQESPWKCIAFEGSVWMKGVDQLGDLFKAIVEKNVLSVICESFLNSDRQEYTLHPYYLKQFENRWFLIAHDPSFDSLIHLALDRIVSFRKIGLPFKNTDTDFKKHFKSVYGLSVPPEAQLTKIMLKATHRLAAHLDNQPIHPSQKLLSTHREGVLFSLEVLPNEELEKKLISFGDDLVVTAPEWFIQRIQNRLLKMLDNLEPIVSEGAQ